ncbi:MAG: pilus assembly protein PilP [Candidatus Schekmanbacteria bacterium]|nr:pilus assembly protein PilP [Candidatus Schekmanbacteria bacterium]
MMPRFVDTRRAAQSPAGWRLRLILGSLVVLNITVAAAAAENTPTPQPEDSAAPPEVTGAATGATEAAGAAENTNLEGILSDAPHFLYDPGGRRDPFRSLLQAGEEEEGIDREKGPAGTNIDELVLKGILKDQNGKFYALMVANDAKTHRIYAGDKVWDGRVAEIKADEVIFEQAVINPIDQKEETPRMIEVKLRSTGKR